MVNAVKTEYTCISKSINHISIQATKVKKMCSREKWKSSQWSHVLHVLEKQRRQNFSYYNIMREREIHDKFFNSNEQQQRHALFMFKRLNRRNVLIVRFELCILLLFFFSVPSSFLSCAKTTDHIELKICNVNEFYYTKTEQYFVQGQANKQIDKFIFSTFV